MVRAPQPARFRRARVALPIYSFLTTSPARIVPERMILAFTPRSLSCLPTGVLMNFKASSP